VASAGGRRWLERLAGVAVGSLVTAWWMRGEPVAPDLPAQPAVEPPVVASDPAAVDPPATIRSDAGTQPDPSDGPEIEPAAIAPAPEQPRAPAAAGAPPSLPLPRMPGSTRLSDAARYDDASGTWVLRAAYRVNARPHHVVAFYSKALTDAGLELTSGEDPSAADGTLVTYLYGRSQRIHAQLSVRTRPGDLEARIGILWRVRG
jgi:hypothetical protein